MELAACLFESGFDLPGEMLEKAKLLFLGIFLTPLRHIWDLCHISCNFVILMITSHIEHFVPTLAATWNFLHTFGQCNAWIGALSVTGVKSWLCACVCSSLKCSQCCSIQIYWKIYNAKVVWSWQLYHIWNRHWILIHFDVSHVQIGQKLTELRNIWVWVVRKANTPGNPGKYTN